MKHYLQRCMLHTRRYLRHHRNSWTEVMQLQHHDARKYSLQLQMFGSHNVNIYNIQYINVAKDALYQIAYMTNGQGKSGCHISSFELHHQLFPLLCIDNYKTSFFVIGCTCGQTAFNMSKARFLSFLSSPFWRQSPNSATVVATRQCGHGLCNGYQCLLRRWQHSKLKIKIQKLLQTLKAKLIKLLRYLNIKLTNLRT